MLEKEIENQIVEYAESLDAKALKLRIDGQNGWPDRTVIFPLAPAFTIEVKKPGGRLSAKQKYWHSELWRLGMKNYVVDNIDDAIQILDARGEVHRIPKATYERTVDFYLGD